MAQTPDQIYNQAPEPEVFIDLSHIPMDGNPKVSLPTLTYRTNNLDEALENEERKSKSKKVKRNTRTFTKTPSTRKPFPRSSSVTSLDSQSESSLQPSPSLVPCGPFHPPPGTHAQFVPASVPLAEEDERSIGFWSRLLKVIVSHEKEKKPRYSGDPNEKVREEREMEVWRRMV
jgi:hypothetical protein